VMMIRSTRSYNSGVAQSAVNKPPALQPWFAWIVALRLDQDIAGYALFVGHADGNPEEAPDLRGVFDTFEEAEAELATEGSVANGEKHV